VHDLRVNDVVTPSRRLAAADRLAIYRRAYFARLLDCLKAEYPAVLHAAGDEAFAGLAAGYLRSHPSTSYTLAMLGHRFADYLQQSHPPRGASLDFADFLIDLARLERCYAEVFDAEGPEQGPNLRADDLSDLALERFAETRLVFHPTVRLLTLNFPCHEYASSVRRGESPTPPAPQTTWLIVFRRNFVVRRRPVSRQEFDILLRLATGGTVGQAVQLAALATDDSAPLEDVLREWFATWAAAPFFRGLITTSLS
jgi:hypothetical protein